ncbi:ATP-binding protein [Alteromonas ponticola]|uniref:histidine kinase n=1 Tax=Alteromonas aquimaris TaxID=2998417 RepID=A0ABT3P346_9ALTE|nr:ATP-binding protein [Alteromonas aquimaris]MCW8107173.1 ATP-binding protein [Alteromonas aquimaris]
MSAFECYQRIMALLPEPSFIVSLSGRILALNRKTKEQLGDALECDGWLFDAIEESSHQDTRTFLRHCARSNQPVMGIMRWRVSLQVPFEVCNGGLLEPRTPASEPILLLRLHNRTETNSRFIALENQINALHQEIERRKHIQTQLDLQKTHLKTTLASIGEGVVVVDMQGRISFINSHAERMCGWAQSTAVGRSVGEVLTLTAIDSDGSDYEEVHCLMSGSFEKGYEKIVKLVAKDGARRTIELTVNSILHNDAPNEAVLVFRDVTQKRRLERELVRRTIRLEEMNHRKNKFLTMLAHELRSPIAPIANAVHIMKAENRTAEQTRHAVQVVERQINHMQRLIDDMLDVSRVVAEKLYIVKTDVEMVSLVETVCGDMNSQFKQRHINCVIDLPSSPIWFAADMERMRQVLHNLLNNSLKFTPQGGTITVRLFSQSSELHLQVQDTGPGIEEDAIGTIFEPFTQAEQPLDRPSGGLGLGLSLVKGIVELHDGQIRATCTGPDQGLTISIVLPLQEQSVEPPQKEEKVNHFTLQKVLIIEDDKDNAETLSELLRLLGHEVVWAPDGVQGIEMAGKFSPTLIFCDIGLPGLDGFRVAERIRSQSSLKSTRLIALSGYSGRDFRRRAKQAGFDHHLVKPASLAELQNVLHLPIEN